MMSPCIHIIYSALHENRMLTSYYHDGELCPCAVVPLNSEMVPHPLLSELHPILTSSLSRQPSKYIIHVTPCPLRSCIHMSNSSLSFHPVSQSNARMSQKHSRNPHIVTASDHQTFFFAAAAFFFVDTALDAAFSIVRSASCCMSSARLPNSAFKARNSSIPPRPPHISTLPSFKAC